MRITPARIRCYLANHKVPCRKCGYPLLGLPEPRCPECGSWTDVTERLRTHNLRLIRNRLGSLGTVDEYLVRRWSGKVLWLRRFEDVRELRVVSRWSRRTRGWLILLACLALGEAFAFLALLANYPGPHAAIGMGIFMVLGMVLVILAVGLEPEIWVMVGTSDRSFKVPLHTVGESEARERVTRLREVIEEGRGRPPTPEPDPQAEGVKEGRCHQCGYELCGPRLMIDAPARGARALGVLAIAFGLFTFFCFGTIVTPSLYGVPKITPLAWIIGTAAASFIVGIWLLRRRRFSPAVPNWKGPGQCPACGWSGGSPGPWTLEIEAQSQ